MFKVVKFHFILSCQSHRQVSQTTCVTYTTSKQHGRMANTQGRGEGGVLWISSYRDDRMGAKIKTPQKIPGPKINPKEIPCQILRALKISRKHNDKT